MRAEKQVLSEDKERRNADSKPPIEALRKVDLPGYPRRLQGRLVRVFVSKLGNTSLSQKQVMIELLCWSGVLVVFSITPVPAVLGTWLASWAESLWDPTALLGAGFLFGLMFLTWSLRCWVELGKKSILSETDPLTELGNRRHFVRLLAMELSRVKRHSRPLSVIMFDIDDFKSINDRLGHGAGDEVLKQVSGLVKITLRDQDHVARWGGDEFVIMTPETDLLGSFQVAERLRYLFCKHDFGEAGRVTASFGVTRVEYQDDADSFLSRVDRLLYLAKGRGKNVVQTEPINLVARAAVSRQPELMA